MKAIQNAEARRSRRGAPPKSEPAARDRILATAAELFYREGIRAIGVDTVVERAGVSKTTLYRVFASKDELIAAFIAEQDRLFWVWWDRTVAPHQDAPGAQLKALLAGIAKRIAHPRYRGCPFINLATELPATDHPARQIALANKTEMRERLARICAEAGAREPERLAKQLVLAINGAYATGVAGPASGLDRTLADAAEALIAAQTTA